MSNYNNKNEEILSLYFNEHKSIDFISSKIKISKPGILKILKKDIKKYKKERNERLAKNRQKKEEEIKQIQFLFYQEKISPSDIALCLSVSKSTVTRAIQLSDDYEKEKENRKKRTSSSDDSDIADLLNKQRRHSISMSKTKKISDRGIVEMNLSHYHYNSENGFLEFDESCGKRPADLPAKF